MPEHGIPPTETDRMLVDENRRLLEEIDKLSRELKKMCANSG